MDRQPKLLFLAYYYPPSSAVGEVRAACIAKYLARRNWDVTIVTPDPSIWRANLASRENGTAEPQAPHLRMVHTNHSFRCLSPHYLRSWNAGPGKLWGKIARRFGRLMSLEPESGWVSHAIGACGDLKREDVDVILASGAPFCSFAVARELGRRLRRPYVLDYRDLWNAGNPHSSTARARAIRREGSLLSGSSAVTVVSENWAAALENVFAVGKKCHVLSNGYDPEDLSTAQANRFDEFAIVYTGIFYPPKRVINPVMAALRSLKRSPGAVGVDWRFHYYGPSGAMVEQAASEYGVQDSVVLHGIVPRDEARAATKGARIAVVITSVEDSDSISDRGIVTSKIYEAIGLGTKVLLIAPHGSDAEKVLSGNRFGECFTGRQVDDIAVYLRKAMREPPSTWLGETEFAWPQLSAKLDGILRSVI